MNSFNFVWGLLTGQVEQPKFNSTAALLYAAAQCEAKDDGDFLYVPKYFQQYKDFWKVDA